MRRTAAVKLTLLLMLVPTLTVLLSACNSTVSPDFTPEQIQWGVGCRGPNATLYCFKEGR